MKILYFDCFSGISGDMTIASLVDAGGDANYLEEELKKLGIDNEYELKWDKVIKNGISSTKFDVVLVNDDTEHKHNHGHEHQHTHDHDDHSHDQGHQHTYDHDHSHDHDHQHTHDHSHNHDHHHGHTHTHQHRSYKDIVNLIQSAGFAEQVQNMALDIFRKIGEAEGRIHGMPLEEVHFHEVGAVDSIIDIVGAAILIHQLEIDQVQAAPVPVGGGKIHIDHGVYPVPAPATLEILRGVPIAESDLKAELTTPTGAAIIAVLAEEFGSMPSFKVDTIGYGAGTKTFPNHPNVLRTIIGE